MDKKMTKWEGLLCKSTQLDFHMQNTIRKRIIEHDSLFRNPGETHG